MTRLFMTDLAQHHEARRPSPGELSLSSVLAFVRSNWAFMLPVVAIFLVAGVVYALAAPAIYQANALVKVDISENSPKGGTTNLNGLFEAKSATSAEIEMIKTRSVVSQAVDQYRLDIVARPTRMPVVGGWFARKAEGPSSPGLWGHGHTAWGNESIDVSAFNVPPNLERKTFSILSGPDGSYQLRLGDTLSLPGKVGVALRHTTPDGELLLFVARFNARPGIEFALTKLSRDDAIESLQKAILVSERGKQSGLIGISLDGPNPALASGIVNAVARQYIQQNINLKTEDAERSLAFLDTQLPALKAAIDTAEAKYSAFRNARGTIDVGEEAKAILQQSILAQTRLAELRQRRAELLTRFQNDNQFVEGVNQQIRAVSGEISDINEKIRRIPATEQDLVRLTRDVKVNSELYAALLNTSQQLRLSKASRVGSAKLIDAAVTPSTPVGPKRGLVVAGAAIAGLVLALLAAFVRGALRSGIESQQEFAKNIAIPLIAVVPHSKYQAQSNARLAVKRGRASLLAADASDEGAVESLRTFRAALQHASQRAANNIVLVAGPTAGVGKSFIAANLGAVLANAGSKVLLIDGDLRGGYLHRYFGLPRGAGFAELIAGEILVREAVSASAMPGLDFISTGSSRLRPGDAFNSGRMARLLAELSGAYDYVIIDSAPVLAVADALVLSSHAGMVFCVARKGRTTVDQIMETNARFAQSGRPIDGVVFNDALPSDLAYGYGADYRRRIGFEPKASALATLES
ncbi:MAG: tyrosine protein kinase [Comamonadaceae bacterium]|nr:MAG: tyrosine protein kinase [Comamonadaceae bacterium]